MTTPVDAAARRTDTFHAVLAGVVTAVVGFSSSFAVVIAGLRGVGADAAQAASGLLAVSVTMGLGCVVFALAYRRPITIAWSTPGAALLASSVAPSGGFAVAVGAFVVTGLLLAVTGFVPALAAAVRRIPNSVANAMLAGVLLTLCIAPFRDLAKSPAALGTMIAVWAVMAVLLPRWAVPAALVVVLVETAMAGGFAPGASLVPQLVWITPAWTPQAMLAIALPLYLVTMTSQNIPGVTVMASFGYEVPLRPALAYTGLATSVGALFGGHAINLSAIAAALAAGEEAGRDRSRRWIAALSCGVCYVLFGLTSQAVVAAAQAAPPGLFAGLAGVALLGSLAGAASQALEAPAERLAAITTLAVAASGVQVGGIGSAFWALVAGGVLTALTRWAGRRKQA